MSDPIIFSPENVQRLARVCNRVEEQPYNDPPVDGPLGRPSAAHTALIKVTGAISGPYYPCNWQTFDPDTQAKANGGTEAGWAVGPNGGVLNNGSYYIARMSGIHAADSKAVWIAVADLGTCAMVNVNSATPGGDGTYDATLQIINAGALSLSSGPSVWFWDPNRPGLLIVNQIYLGLYAGVYNSRPLYVRDDFRLQWLTSAGAVAVDNVLKQEIGQDTNLVTDDFVVTNSSARIALIRTNGSNGDGILYQYACVSGNLTQYQATVRVGDGLIKSGWPPVYA